MRRIMFSPAVEELLATSGLIAEDLRNSKDAILLGEEQAGRVTGLIGLECYGDDALLRSLAVAVTERRKGMGKLLVSYAEERASSLGVCSLYLLTTTAQNFFKRLGFEIVERESAPKEIATTSQFSELCPASSVFMVKHLHS